MTYIATFFSHFGAVRYKKQCEAAGWPARLMPVPRSLSSSCGTCVRYEIPTRLEDSSALPYLPRGFNTGEVEKVVEATTDGYRHIYICEGLE